MSIVRESLYNFHKTGNIKSSLGIGREGMITEFLIYLGLNRNEFHFDPDGRVIIDREILDMEKIARETDMKEIILPDNMTVRGRLDMRACPKVKSLPNGLRVMGDALTLAGEKTIKELPDDLYVAGSLYLNYSAITSVPDSIYVGSFIYITSKKLYSDLKSKPKWNTKIVFQS